MTSEEYIKINILKKNLEEALKYTSGDQYDGAGFFICLALDKIEDIINDSEL